MVQWVKDLAAINAVAWFAAIVQVQPLAWEFLHGHECGKKKLKKKS